MPDFTPSFIKSPGELLSVPFSAATDFTVLADHCETFAETLIESGNPTLTNALNRRWPKGERLIAEALGVAPEKIWPSRYR
ncbi:TPA: helix-turn-helix domain-containing protein [Klebsiella aerogenes]|nr:helix-turn-helix domain-containing protein [Klebsiella aerogenes]